MGRGGGGKGKVEGSSPDQNLSPFAGRVETSRCDVRDGQPSSGVIPKRSLAVFSGVEHDTFQDDRRGRASIPTGLDHSAQGWPDSGRAYLGSAALCISTLKGLNPND